MTPISLSSTSPVSRLESTRRSIEPAIDRPEPTGPGRDTDSVSLSEAARRPVAQGTPISGDPARTERVQQIKAQIAAGTYENPEKYLTALARALADAQRNG